MRCGNFSPGFRFSFSGRIASDGRSCCMVYWRVAYSVGTQISSVAIVENGAMWNAGGELVSQTVVKMGAARKRG